MRRSVVKKSECYLKRDPRKRASFRYYNGSSIIRTLRGNQKSFELWSVRVMELQFNVAHFHGSSAFVRIMEQFELWRFELWRFELWRFHCITITPFIIATNYFKCFSFIYNYIYIFINLIL